MKGKIMHNAKKGAASFYMIAFSTLILIIIVTSFAAVIISEVTRTANDDLSQSAYDSALAGVEDAKLLIHNYQKCITENDNGEGWCKPIRDYVEGRKSGTEATQDDCDTVGRLLGRIEEGQEGNGVSIQESNVSNNMSQAYTCVKIGFPGDYRSSSSSTSQAKVVKTKFADGVAKNVRRMKISWSNPSQENLNYKNFDKDKNEVVFPSGTVSTPPTIAVSLIQTAESFTLDQFTETSDNATNRGTIFLVPTDSEISKNPKEQDPTYRSAYHESENHIGRNGFIESNNQAAKNLPYTVYCPLDTEGSEYGCSTLIDIPDPIGGSRNPETFVIVVTSPYGGIPEFKLDFMCDEACNVDAGEDASEEEKQIAKLDGVQIEIDSTGRANDMYRRVGVRLEGDSDYPLSILGPLELLNTDAGDSSFVKDLSPTSEYNF